MKDGRAQVLQWIGRFWRRWQKITECKDMKNDKVHVLQRKGHKWRKQQFGRELQKFTWLADKIQVAWRKWLFGRTWQEIVEWNDMKYDRIGNSWKQWQCDAKSSCSRNSSICYLTSDRFFIDSNEEQRSCTRIIDSIGIKEDNYAYVSSLVSVPLCPAQLKSWYRSMFEENANTMYYYAGACITDLSLRTFNN